MNLRSFLCYFGCHRYGDPYVWHTEEEGKRVVEKCLRCSQMREQPDLDPPDLRKWKI